MKKYLNLMRDFPSLFNNDDAPLQIIRDTDMIQTWQEGHRKLLSENNLPLEWADIGVILDDPFNIVVRDLVRFPDGDMRGYGRSIATASLRGGKATVVFPEYDGKILLLRIYRHATRQWHYEVPRGYGEPNISTSENARNEIKEETGGEIVELVNLGDVHNNDGYETVAVSLFYANLKSVGAGNINEGIESFVWLTVKELEEWIANEKITDSFTIAAYTRAKLKGLI